MVCLTDHSKPGRIPRKVPLMSFQRWPSKEDHTVAAVGVLCGSLALSRCALITIGGRQMEEGLRSDDSPVRHLGTHFLELFVAMLAEQAAQNTGPARSDILNGFLVQTLRVVVAFFETQAASPAVRQVYGLSQNSTDTLALKAQELVMKAQARRASDSLGLGNSAAEGGSHPPSQWEQQIGSVVRTPAARQAATQFEFAFRGTLGGLGLADTSLVSTVHMQEIAARCCLAAHGLAKQVVFGRPLDRVGKRNSSSLELATLWFQRMNQLAENYWMQSANQSHAISSGGSKSGSGCAGVIVVTFAAVSSLLWLLIRRGLQG